MFTKCNHQCLQVIKEQNTNSSIPSITLVLTATEVWVKLMKQLRAKNPGKKKHVLLDNRGKKHCRQSNDLSSGINFSGWEFGGKRIEVSGTSQLMVSS